MSNRFVSDFFGALAAAAVLDEAALVRRRAEARRMEEVASLRARLARLENGSDDCGSDIPSAPAFNLGGFRTALRRATFDSDRLDMMLGVTHPLTCAEAALLLQVFTFDEDRVSAARHVYARIVDPANWYQVVAVFTFSSSKADVRRIGR